MPKCLLFFILLPGFLSGQKDTSEQLSPVVVRDVASIVGMPPDWPPLKTPANPLQLSTTQNLNLAPGIAAFEGTAGTAKFSYRGMGARTQYSTSRSLVYLDEIPLTSIQGFSSFEDLNPLWVPGLRFIDNHGESFPLALGGVLKYAPLGYGPGRSYEDTVGVYSELNFGSFGLLQSNSVAWVDLRKFELLAGYEKTSKTGWRENNSLQRESLFLNASWNFTGNKSLKLITYALKNRVEIPSSLSREDFEENPAQAAESWGRTEGFKEYDRLITGLTYSGGKPLHFTYKLTTFYRYLDNFEPRPFNILMEKRHSGGLRFRLQKDSIKLGSANGMLFSFGEYQIGSEDAATFENRFDSSDNTYNNAGANLNDTRILGQRFNGGLTLQTEFLRDGRNDKEYWVLATGANAFYQYNQLQGDAEENYNVPFILAPLVNLKYVNAKKGFLAPELGLYRSFSVPALEENLDPDGRLNRELEPELAWTGELGLNWRLGKMNNNQLKFTYYYTEVENLIVPRVIGPDQVVATNSGSSRHTGLEFQLSNQAFVPWGKNWAPHFIISGYYGSFSYIEFSDTAGSFSGNELPGFPEWQVNASFELKYDNHRRWETHSIKDRGNNFQFSAGFLGRYTTGYFINDENTVETEPYLLLQGWLRGERTFGKHFTASANFGIRNLTDTHYASMTVVNNQAFGGAPRFYYPGEPINWFGGVGASWSF